MRKLLTLGALLAMVVVGCENKTPTGPGTVTVDQRTTTTTPATTTTVPNGTGSTTTVVTPPATTTAPPPTVTRRYVGASTQATVPNDMTLFFQLLFAVENGLAEAGERSVPITTMASYTVTGVYRTSSGAGGTVVGSLSGDVDNGQFTGTLIFDAPGCTAEREYTGTITAAAVTLSGGRTLRDCKDNPLSWDSLTLVRGDGLPITTSTPTTTPGACTYGISPTSASIGGAGGVGDVDVTSQPGCGWSSQSFVPWVTVQPTAAPTGNGKARYTVQPNGGGPRTTTLVIAGQPFTLTQLAEGVGVSTTTSSTSTSSSTTSGPSTSSTTTSGPSTISSSSTSTSISTSTSTTSTTSSIGPGFAATVYPNMLAPAIAATCESCHPQHISIGTTAVSARAWAMSSGRSDTVTSNFVVKPSGQVAHSGGQLWNQTQTNAAIAWINGGRQP